MRSFGGCLLMIRSRTLRRTMRHDARRLSTGLLSQAHEVHRAARESVERLKALPGQMLLGAQAAGCEIELESAQIELDNALAVCELASCDGDDTFTEEALEELHALRRRLRDTLLEAAMVDSSTGRPPASGCFLELQAAPGGGDSCYWLSRLVRMYTEWAAAREGYAATLVSSEEPFGTQEYVGGYRSACLQLTGPRVHGWMRGEDGVHCFKHITPFRTQSKQTGFVRVVVLPVANEAGRKLDHVLQRGDVRVDTMRAGGKGGQHVNATDSCVRVVHEPTGIAVRISSSRSQHSNKSLAFALLESKLRAAQLDSERAERSALYAAKGKDTFGAQIRTYRFIPPNIAHDHRTGARFPNPASVLDHADGLDELIEAWLLSTCTAAYDTNQACTNSA